jgi:hypothetical protein
VRARSASPRAAGPLLLQQRVSVQAASRPERNLSARGVWFRGLNIEALVTN